MGILIRSNEDVVILDEKELSFESLTEIFLKDTYRSVYVTKDKNCQVLLLWEISVGISCREKI